MAGGVLQIVGLLALLCVGCRSLIRFIDRRALRARAIADHQLADYHYTPRPERDCAWPVSEPEVEQLRRSAAL